jgi:hypothetical protein
MQRTVSEIYHQQEVNGISRFLYDEERGREACYIYIGAELELQHPAAPVLYHFAFLINQSLRQSYARYVRLCDVQDAMEHVQQSPHIVSGVHSGFLPCPEEPYRMAGPPDHSAEYRQQLRVCEELLKRPETSAHYIRLLEKDIEHIQRLLRDEARKAAGRRYMETLWDGTRAVTEVDMSTTRIQVFNHLMECTEELFRLIRNMLVMVRRPTTAEELAAIVRTTRAELKIESDRCLSGGLGRYMEPTVLRMHEGLERWESLNVPDKLALEELMMETSNELYKLKTDVLKISSE